MTTQPRTRTSGINLLQRWGDLSISIKLRVTVLVVLIAVLLLVLATLQNALDTAAYENIQQSQNQRLDVLNGSFTQFIDSSQNSAGSVLIDSNDALHAYLLAQTTTPVAQSTPALANLSRALLSRLAIYPDITEVRFITSDGQQVIHIYRNQMGAVNTEVVEPQNAPKIAAAYFPAVVKQARNQTFLAAVEPISAPLKAASVPLFTFGSTVYLNDKAMGAVLFGFSAEKPINDLFSLLSTNNQTTVGLLDANRRAIAAFDNGRRYALDATPYIFAHPLPAVVFGAAADAQKVGDQIVSSRPLQISALNGTQVWHLFVIQSSGFGFNVQGTLLRNTLLPLLLIFLGVGVISVFLGRAITQPVRDVTRAARLIAGGDLNVQVPVRSQDEIGQMSQSLNAMVKQSALLINTLEARVIARTRDLEIASEISRDAASSRNTQELLQDTINAIRERFGFYHVQVFLVDDKRDYAILITSMGEAGRQMLERKHRLAVGSESVIGQVTQKNEPIITQDTQAGDAPHRFNPLLPDTRAEMALPMRVANVVIGALDVQSLTPNVFDENNIQIFQVLADQLAIAVNNARLLNVTQENLQQIATLNSQLTEKGWKEYIQQQGNRKALGFQYDMRTIEPIMPDATGTNPMSNAYKIDSNGSSARRDTLSAAIKVRGATIGTLDANAAADTMLTSDDRAMVQAVADRVALAVENMRLTERTQVTLSEIERLYNASRALGSSSDIEAVYDTAMAQMAQIETVDFVVILRASPTSVPNPQSFVFSATWAREATGVRPFAIGDADTSFGRTFSTLLPDPRTPYVTANLAQLTNNPDVYKSATLLSIESTITAPLTTTENWFGLMLIVSKSPNAFNESVVRFVTAIADQVAIAIENRQLFDEVQAEARRNRALAEAAQLSSRIGVDFTEGFANLLRSVAASSNYDRWWFGRLAADGQTLEQITAHFEIPSDSDDLQMLGSSVSVLDDVSALGEAVRLQTPVVVNELEHYMLANMPHERAQLFGKHLAIPVMSGDTVSGALLIGRGFEKTDLDERDLQLISTLGSQLAIALENRRLFTETETGRQTLQTVVNSLPVGVIVVDAQTRQVVLNNAQASRLLGLDKADSFTMNGIVENQARFSDDFAPYRVLASDQQVTLQDVVVTHADESHINLLINAVPLRDAQDSLIGAVAVFTNTTEIRELQGALQANLRETTSLYTVSRAISNKDSLIGIVEIAMGEIFSILKPDTIFAVFQNQLEDITQIYHAEKTSRSVISEWDDPLPFDRSLLISMQENIINNNTRRPALPSDTQPKHPNRRDPAVPFAALGAFPLKARNRTIGWWVVGYQQPNDINADDRRFLGSLADQSATAIEAIQLSAQTIQALRETETLYRASSAIFATNTINDAVIALRVQVQQLNPDRIDVFMFDPHVATDRADWLVRWEAQPPDFRDTMLIANTYITDVDLLTREPMYVENLSAARPAEVDTLRRLPLSDNIQAQISLPLRIKMNYVGRLVISFFEPRQFSAFERRFVSTLLEQVSVVMDNATLFRQSHEQGEETATLYQTTRAIADAVDNIGVLRAIVDQALAENVNRVMLVRLVGTDWNTPTSAVDVVADWSQGSGLDMQGMRFMASQFPGWRELSTPDILWIDDIMTSPQLSDESRMGYLAFDIAAFVMVPLVAAGKPIGTLLIGSSEPHEHNDRELRIYTSLANTAAIAMENRNLLSQAQARARQLSTSSQVGQAATSILNLNELLDRSVQLIKESFRYDQVQIFLISADGLDAVLQASTGDSGSLLLAKHHKLGVGSASVIGRVTSSAQLYNVSDTADSRMTHRPNAYLPGTRSELALPLIAKGAVVGALDVQSNQPGAFTEEDERALATLADQIAIAIDNARLFESSNKRAEEMRFLFNVTTTATSATLNTALNQVVRLILTSPNFNTDLAAILLIDEDRKRLLITYATRESAPYIVPPSLPVDLPAIAQVMRTRRLIAVNQDAESVLFNPDDVPGLQSMLLIPLLSGNEFVGILTVASEQQNVYGSDIIQLLQTLTSTLTAIIQNGRLLSEVSEANLRLQEVDKLKSQFLANMSHELRTPLNSIIGFSRVILKGIDGPLNDVQAQDITTIYDSGNHLLNLVNDILDQAKIEAGKMELAPEFFDINELIKSGVATTLGLVKDKPIRLHQEIQADLPEVYSDKFRTRQVLLNMLSNASKFTQQGSITISAFTIIDGSREMVQVSVTDTGMGIARENIRRVFAQFEQVDNSTARGAEGSGLGMPIAKSLMEMQGGRMWIENTEVGVGSTFSITIPIAPIEVPEAEALPEADLEAQIEQVISMTETPVQNQGAQRIIVVVEAETSVISMYRSYLARTGYEVIGTTNPDDATELILTYKPRVVLLNVNMPQRDGWGLLRQLKDNDATFQYPVIVCSIEDDKARGYQLGASNYLIKPFIAEDLIGAIRQIELERNLPTVLVIDNQAESLRLIREALSAEEDLLRVIEADNGEQGLTMIGTHQPDLVILDLRMPEMDGFEVLQRIRNNPDTREQRIMVVTAADLSAEERSKLLQERVELKEQLTGDNLLKAVKAVLKLSK